MTIRFIVDSAADMPETDRDDTIVLPMTIAFGETEYRDGIDLTHRQFYERLIEDDELPKTSQITPFAFDQAISSCGEQDEIIIVTVSSKLSGTYESALSAAVPYGDRVHVIDSKCVSVGERALVERGYQLKEQGLSAVDIAAKLREESNELRIIALLDTLEYLYKGGRISRATALAGGALSIKPVASMTDGEIVVLGKARGSRKGNNLLTKHVEQAGGIDFDRPVMLGYTGLSDALIRKYAEDSRALWKHALPELRIATIGGTIGTHVGPNAIALAFFPAAGE